MDFIFRAAEKFLKDHKRLMRYRRVFAVLAAVVVFATTYELILPAITIDRQRAAETPGMEVGVAAEEAVEDSETEDSVEDGAEAEVSAPDEEAVPDASETQESEEVQAEAEEEGGEAAEEDTAVRETVENADDGDADRANVDKSADETVDETTEDTVDSEEITESPTDAAADTNVAATEEAAATAATEAPAVEYPVTLTCEGDGYTITATFDETANLPAGVSLDALEILPDMVYRDEDGKVLYDDYEVYFEKAVDAIEKDDSVENNGVSSARFFDISFIDSQGCFVEPSAPVTVSVKYDDALSTDETASTVAVHFDNSKDKTEIIETREDVKKDAIEEISFDGDRFSVYAIVGIRDNSGNNIAITEGESVTFEASVSESNASDFEWSVNNTDSDVVSITNTNGKEVTLNAKAAGFSEVTLSYQYRYKNKGRQTGYATHVYTVIVEEQGGDTTNPDYELENTENSGLTVTIKETGQVKKALSAYKLAVKPVSDSDDEYSALERETERDTGDSAFDFLRMYHIYFVDKDDATETEVPYDTVLETLGIGEMNLQVTLTYDTAPEGWPAGNSVKVGHYKVNGSSVENAKVAASAGGAEANIQNIKVSGNSVSLHIKSFSVIVLSSTNSSYTDQSSSQDTGSTSPAIDPEENKNTANSWQVAEGMYGDAAWTQTSDDGYVYSNDNLFRIQKNIVPTGTENEFDVYLNVEPTLHWDFQEIFKASSIFISNSNSQTQEFETQTATQDIYVMTAQQFKDTYASGSGNISKLSDSAATAETSDYHTAGSKQYHVKTITVLDGKGNTYKTFTTDLYYYHTTGSNITTYVVLPTNHYKMYKVHLGFEGNKNGGTVNLTMPYATYDALVNEIINDGNFSALIPDKLPAAVTDPMGDHIEYMDSLKVTNGSAAYDASTKRITWNNFTAPAASNDPSDFEENIATTTIADYFRENIYQIKYHIRLKTEDTDYTSQSIIPTNGTTTMTDTSNVTTNFPIPKVKGTRYKVQIRKKDQATGCWIDGSADSAKTAAFVLSGGSGTVSGVNTVSATVGNDGYYTFDAELVGLDGKHSGTYYITETDAPDGYIKPTEATVVSIGNYTADSTAFTDVGNLYLYKSGSDEYITIENTPINVAILKVDDSTAGKPLENAEFSLTPSDGTAISGRTDSDGYIYFKNVAAGTYTLRETAEPDGYNKTFTSATIIVNNDGSVIVSNAVDDAGDSVSGMITADGTVKKKDTGEHERSYAVIKVVNTSSELSLLLRKTGQDSNALPGATLSIKNNGTEALTTDQINSIISNGSSTISLMPGTEYVIGESKAPAGYKKLESDITFKLVPDETSQIGYILTDSSGNELTDSMLSISKEDKTVVLRLKNDQGAVLPETGGTGFLSPLTLCGIMAMAFVLATAVMYGFSVRRGERRYE